MARVWKPRTFGAALGAWENDRSVAVLVVIVHRDSPLVRFGDLASGVQ